MGTFAVGDVVLISFPYADLSRFKKRPAIVVGQAEFDNLILCQVTSKAKTSKRAIPLEDADFLQGSLQLASFIRPDKLFTVEQSVIEARVGVLRSAVTASLKSVIRQLFA